MPTLSTNDYTATTTPDGLAFTPKKGQPLTVPYGALESITWAPNTRKVGKGKAPLTQVNFVYRNKEQNSLPKPLRIGDSMASATPENMAAIEAIREQIINADPMPEWKQEVKQDELNKAQGKRAIKIIIGLIIVVGLAIWGFSSCSGKDDGKTSAESGTTSSAKVEKRETNTLTWEAETSGGTAISVTYTTKGMNISQESDAASPWAKDIQVKSKYDLIGANMSAQNTGSGDVTCRAKWNGKVVSKNTSKGEFTIASCSIDIDDLD